MAGCQSADYGGGVYSYAGGTLTDCTLSDNWAQWGGGVYCYIGGTLSDCTLADNSATQQGGGAFCDGGGTLSNCTVSGNSAPWGGGVKLQVAGALVDCTISNNTASSQGGGVYSYGDGTIERSIISGNSSPEGGGTLCYLGGIVNNSLFHGNTASSQGGGVFLVQGGTLRNCTVSGNAATNYGGGLYVSLGGTNYNTIIYGNTAGISGENYTTNGGGTFAYSCTTPDPGGTGNITNDPQFVDAPSGDYRVQPSSPCVNAGTNQAWMAAALDLDGRPRLNAGSVDMGAYEWNPLQAGFGTALEFDGVDDYVTLSTNLASAVGGGDAITIEYWFRGSQLQSPVRIEPGGYIVAGWSAVAPQHIISTDGGANGVSCGDETIIEDGRWHHLAMTWQRNTTNGFRSYLDGELVAQRASADVALPALSGATPRLGSYNGTGEFLKGELDEVRIWDAALSPTVLTNWMYRGIDASHAAYSNLVSYYKMDDGAGASVIDTANGHDGTLASNMTSSAWVASEVRDWVVYTGDTLVGYLVGSSSSGASSNGLDWALNFEVVMPPVLGVVTVTTDNVFAYTAPEDQRGQDSFSYRVRDDADNVSGDHTVLIDVVASAPSVTVTTAPHIVYGEVSTYTIAGTNNRSVVGTMGWTNAASGAGGEFSAPGGPAYGWQIIDVPLAFGANVITVSGSNFVGSIASDSITIERSIVHGGDSPIHYVSTHGTSIWPYTNWVNAATNIQDAIDTAAPDDKVLVTNGTYASGAQISVNSAITVESVNGPAVTIVDGEAAHRVFYLGSTACVLSGFTITNGKATAMWDNSGGGVYCSDYTAIVTNCTLVGNSATYSGGGSYYGRLIDCTLSGNSADEDGGGSYYSTLENCTLEGNSSGGSGGGSYYGELRGCTLRGNSAVSVGGGSCFGALHNCLVVGNSTDYRGGGSYYGTLYNCTVTGNSAGDQGGGAFRANLYNCIAYFNHAPVSENYHRGGFYYSCTTPAPGGVGNITNNPMLVSASHIHPDSPCVGGGGDAYATGTDIDGDSWASPPSMGCHEAASSATGELFVAIGGPLRVVVGYELACSAEIVGDVASNQWSFSDGATLANAAHGIHVWAATGNYDVVLSAYNDHYPAGVAATVQVHVVAESIHHVCESNAASAAPYTTWGTAATSIQDAVDEAEMTVGSTVLVSNGTYLVASPVRVAQTITVRSANGPGVTFVDGQNAHRCFELGDHSIVLDGFTIRHGSATDSTLYSKRGGGVYSHGSQPTITNCTIAASSADYGGGSCYGTLNDCTLTSNTASYYGGGSYFGALYNCTLSSNSASDYGGGSYDGMLNNCTLSSNSAHSGGGSYEGVLTNCNLVGNSAIWNGGGSYYAILNNCTLSNNTATAGGGSFFGTLNGCTFSTNSATTRGGGSYRSTLNDCILTGNSAPDGGGSYEGTLSHCVFSGNAATQYGGGSCQSTLYNCLFHGNTAANGGGSYAGTLYNCTLTGNSATNSGGGSIFSAFVNSIIYNNTAVTSNDTYGGTCSYSCSPGLSGSGNINSDPQFLDASETNYYLRLGSPCVDSGTNLVTITDDLDGNPRPVDGNVDGTNTHDMGAYEYTPALVDSDYDGRNDLMEMSDPRLDPLYDENGAISYGESIGESNVTSNPIAYNLYTSNSIMDLNMGYMMISATGSTVRLDLQLEETTDLSSGVWSNAGDAVEWTRPAPDGKMFYRVRGE